MNVRLVTGYVPIADHPRGPAVYGELGEKLGGVPVRKKAFYSQVEHLWMAKYLRSLDFIPRASEGDNPDKNSLAYHIVNHEKTTWLKQAADEYPDADVVVWVDYGIFRLPGVNNESIVKFMESLDDKHIYAPGCWLPAPVESAFPCWRFCGSVLAVPTKLIHAFDYACRTTARQHIQKTHNVEWEVNTWARVEQGKRKFPIQWYRADHNVRMFTDCPTLGVSNAASP